jgi:hypothetical protein
MIAIHDERAACPAYPPSLDELSLMLNAIRRVAPSTAAALSRQLLSREGEYGEVASRREVADADEQRNRGHER